jgi:cytochrome c-type biogenesis protein CcmE
VVWLVLVAGVTLLCAAAMEGAFSFYETPTQLVVSPEGPNQSVRLSGLVVPGSVHRHGSVVRFVLTDGANDVHVVSHGIPPSTFRPGQDAVVQGHFDADHVFRADQLMVRHSNRYGPSQAAGQSPGSDGAG